MSEQHGTRFLPWVGLVTGPVVFLVNVQMSLVTLPWVCATGQYWAVLTAAAASALLTALAGVAAYRSWQAPPRAETETPVATLERFMGFMGILASAFFVVAIFSLWLPAYLRPGCP